MGYFSNIANGIKGPSLDETRGDEIVFVNIHIPRTSGTWLCDSVEAEFGVDACCIDRGEEFYRRIENAQSLDKFRFISGHVAFGLHTKVFSKRTAYVTMLRDPFERALSCINFIRGNVDHYLHPILKNLDDIECFKKIIEVEGSTERLISGQCAMICGRDDFSIAAYYIRHYYFYASTCEERGDLFSVITGGSCAVDDIVNKSHRIQEELSMEAQAFIAQYAFNDVLLYDEVSRNPVKGAWSKPARKAVGGKKRVLRHR